MHGPARLLGKFTVCIVSVLLAACDGDTGPTPPTPPAATAASLTVAPNALSLTRGDSAWLVADAETAAHARLRGQPIAWAALTSGPVVLRGSQGDSVRVVGLAAGATTVRATLGSLSATAAVTVTATAIPVASVTVSPATDTVAAGLGAVFAATPTSSAGAVLAGRTVTWASSTPTVATVDATGKVSALATGTAILTATVDGVAGHATLVVTDIGAIGVTGVPDPFRVGQHVTVGADVRTANGEPVMGRTVSWASLTPSVATLTADGLLTAVAAGEASLVGALDGFADTTVITVLPPVGAVQVSPPVVVVPVGRTFALAVTADGDPISAGDATFTTDAGAIATVSASGVITGAGAGVTHVRVTGGGVTRVVRVAVPAAGTLAFGLSDSLLQPDSILIATAPDLSGASASVGGAAALVSGSTTSLSITAPGSRWGTCLGPDQTFTLALSAGGKSTSIALSAAAKPVAMSMAVGTWAFLPEAARTGGCEVALDAGTYGGVAFVAESLRTTFVDYPDRPLFPVRIEARANVRAAMPAADLTPSFGRVAMARRVPGPSFFAKSLVGLPAGRDEADERLWEAVSPPPASAHGTQMACGSWPTTVGDTIGIRVFRYAANDPVAARRGAFQSVDWNGTQPVEPWTLIVRTAHLSFYADTAMLRAMAANSSILADVQAEAAGYETTVVPLQAKFGITPPDADGLGTIVILVPRQDFGGTFATGIPDGVGRVGCETEGSSIWMPYIWRSANEPSRTGYNVAIDVQTMAHEAGHLWEQPLRNAAAGNNISWYAGEGTARLVEHLWALRDQWQGFDHQLTEPVVASLDGAVNDRTTPFCGPAFVQSAAPGLYSSGSGDAYVAACWFELRMAARLRTNGVPESQVLTALVTGSADQRTLTRYQNGLFGTSTSSEVTWATWMLSLYADGLPGMPADLQDLAWDLAAVTPFRHTIQAPWPFVPSNGGRVTVTLGDGSVIFFTVTSSAPSLFGFFKDTSSAFAVSDRPRLALVRLE